MKLIIFGATGTVGIRLVEQALQSGYQVTAFTRKSAKAVFRQTSKSGLF